ncbi:MAG: NAD(P)H-hydrate dehydratase [Rhodospirillales bacterium]|nr:NAD(P)H-hydrate dehydratase [Rhodospirillales bacterium]
MSGAAANQLLTTDEMSRADRAAIAGGVPGERLMEAAGWAVAREIRRRWTRRPVTVLCGPGNNGGDGFVVARLLRRSGWPVRVALLGSADRLKGDAALNHARWRGPVEAARLEALDGAGLVVDALFGAGLARPLDGDALALVGEINRRRLACVAVDVPSGVEGNTGAVMGEAPRCALTVTFFRKKPAHCLDPGRVLCGDVVVADIGIPAQVLEQITGAVWENAAALWLERLPRPSATGHKYDRGHALIVAGPASGAARLAARAARRIGAGLVTVAAPASVLPVVAGDMPGNLTADLDAYDGLLADRRRNAVLIGPGAGTGEETRRRALAALAAGKACVLDADALTSFSENPQSLFAALGPDCVLTPHDGEFARLFGSTGDRLSRARVAAQDSGAVVLLKGPDTVIAAPDGRAAINTNAPAHLATAGTGDVLAGMIVGLLAQGMGAFPAACAAAWMHGAAADAVGRGLIAEDLPEVLPSVLKALDSGATAHPD